jgi:hypothetical protein
MALRTKIRVSQVTGSFGTSTGQINDQITGVATGSIDSSDLSSVLSHLAASIKRIHGASSFTEGTAGLFQQSLTVTGSITSTTGLSGSLTKLADGTSYLIAGSNVTITSASNGAVTISSTGGSGTPQGSDTQVQFNDGGAFGASDNFVFNKTNNTMSVARLFVSGTGNSLTSSGSIRVLDGSQNVVISLSTAGVISGSSNLQAGGNLTVAGTSELVGNVTVKGNLTVQGTTTTIDTENLLVKDAIILMASGTAGPNKDGGIAIFSGSSTGNDLVFGRIANDTWGAGTLDTKNGTTGSLAEMSMAGIRASNFQVGTSTAKQIQLNGNNLAINSDARIELTGSTIGLVINNAENFLIGTNTGGNFVRIASGTIGSNTNVALFRGETGKDVALRGDKVHFVASGSTGFTHVATVTGSAIIPAADKTFDLGSTSLTWNNLYATNITVTGRGKFTSEVTSSVSADTNYQVSGLDWSAITAANRDKFIDVFVNGSLLLTGSDAGAGSRDYYLGTSNDGVKFTFALTVDDVVAVVVR